MRTIVELMIESELLAALDDLSRQQGTTVAVLIDFAIKEFVTSMEDEIEIFHTQQGCTQLPALASSSAVPAT